MPEHREGTPEWLRDLESFLWWDFDEPELWRNWTAKRGWTAAQASFEEALSLQKMLRDLERVNNGMEAPPTQVARLNQAIKAHALRPDVSNDGEVTIRPSGADDPVGHVLALVVRAMHDGVWKRFKLCRDEVCRASYFDATKNGAKTWCSMETCGSRNKMRRFRAKSA